MRFIMCSSPRRGRTNHPDAPRPRRRSQRLLNNYCIVPFVSKAARMAAARAMIAMLALSSFIATVTTRPSPRLMTSWVVLIGLTRAKPQAKKPMLGLKKRF